MLISSTVTTGAGAFNIALASELNELSISIPKLKEDACEDVTPVKPPVA
jgi:hypothetical protein